MLTTTDLIDKVPIIKSPSFWVPKPVELPPDIHPLPDSVEPYFVYPFAIEDHALSVLPTSLDTLRSNHARNIERLRTYAVANEKARKAHLLAVAPGWNGGDGLILPSKKITASSGKIPCTNTAVGSISGELASLSVTDGKNAPGKLSSVEPLDPMRDFVDGLDSMEIKRTGTGT